MKMKGNNLKRRDVLKTVGTTSVFGVVGATQRTTADKGSIRLVETGLKYDLPTGYNYQQMFVESKSLYDIEDGVAFLSSTTPDEVRETFINNDTIVNGIDNTAVPQKSEGGRTVQAVPTALSQRKEVRELTHVTESHRLPEIRVQVGSKSSTISVEGLHEKLRVGTEREFSLPTQTITAETYRVTDEIAEIEEVPEHKWGPKTEYDSVEIDAVPTVTVRDRGELDLQV